METAGVEPAPPRCKRGVLPEGPRPRGCDPAATRPASGIFALRIHFHGSRACGQVQCGRVESNHHSRRQRGYSAVSSPMLSVHRKWRGWDSNPRSRAHEAREDSRSSTARRALCMRMSDLAGWSRTSGLRFPKPAGWPSPLQPDAVDDRGIEPRVSASSERRLPSRPVVVGCEATAFTDLPRRRRGSERRDPLANTVRRRQGIAPCSTGSRPAGSLLALRRSLAGRIRTPVGHGRSVVLIH